MCDNLLNVKKNIILWSLQGVVDLEARKIFALVDYDVSHYRVCTANQKPVWGVLRKKVIEKDVKNEIN